MASKRNPSQTQSERAAAAAAPFGQGVIVLAVVLAAGLARAETADRVAAVVNNDVVTFSEVELRAAPMMDSINREPPGPKRDADRWNLLRRSFDDLVGEKLMDGELKGMNVDVSDQEVDLAIADVKKQNNINDDTAFNQALSSQGFTPESYREFMKKQLAKVKLLNIKVKSKIKINDEDVKAEYAREAHLDSQDKEIHARHILLQVPATATPEQVEEVHQKALEIARKARQGGDFAALARVSSEGPSAKDGGDLGWFKKGTMVPEFENVAFALKVGEVSDPVRTKFGWHIIKVEDQRAGAAQPFDEVKDRLRDRLYRDQIEHQTASYVSDLRKQAAVDVKVPELNPPEADVTQAPADAATSAFGNLKAP
jgi:peptidyl-prolyl cis-trans isomerase SurA